MRLFQVDAFAGSVFAGNPAAVCLLGGPAEARWMQSVASEMNLSETAFVEPGTAGTGLAEPAERVRFDSASGPLTARREDGLIVLDFPARPAGPAAAPPGLLAA